MQEVQNTTINSATSTTSYTTTQQNTRSSLFQSLLNKEISPEEISFEEYKNLSEEELETLFKNDEESLRHAKGLRSVATWTDDDTFNSIIFNMYVDDINNNTDNGKMYLKAQLASIPKIDGQLLDIDNIDKANLPDGRNLNDAQEMLGVLANIKKFLLQNVSGQPISSKEQERIIAVSHSIVEQYNAKVGEDNVILASYTKTTTVSPHNSEMETENKLFASIIEDNNISYEEIENFSYEQMKQFSNYFLQKNEDGDFIPNPRINIERKAGMALSSTVITKNENFNKAIFHSIRKIEDEETLETFMYDVTGTQFSDKIITYPEFQEVDFKEGVSRFISKQIASYQTKLDNATSEEEKETYETLLGVFTKLENMNKSFNGQSVHDKEDDSIERMKALVEDIISVLKTGFTIKELEYIEKILAEIRKKIKEAKENGTSSEDEIKKMISELERAIAELQKRVTGVAIIEADKDSLQNSEGSGSIDSLDFEARLDAVQDTIEKMKSGALITPEIDTEKTEEEKEEDKKW